MWITSKIKQLFLVLKPGVVTLRYPFEPRPVPKDFRGAPHWDHHKCVGCGACSDHCSARTILVRDICQEIRVMLYDASRCTYCGKCADICPEKAITMTERFELATDNKEDLTERMELFMLTCQRCGRCYDMENKNVIERLDMKGYRYDNLEKRFVIKKTTEQFDEKMLSFSDNYTRPTKVEG